jgi:integrase
MPLTDTTVRNAKATVAPRKLADEKGLYLLVNPSGSKLWRMKYRFAKKENVLSFGGYPEVSLKDAREARDEARALLSKGIDPSAHKKANMAARSLAAENSFELVAREWFAKFSPQWKDNHSSKIIERLEKDIFPWLGTRPINEVGAQELLAALRRIESRGAIETAHRARQNCGQVFRYGIATGRCNRDVAADLKGALQPTVTKHHASIIDPTQIGGLLRAIDSYQGMFVSRSALKLAPLVFLRPVELRQAEWSEFNLDAREWRIPPTKMKMKEMHIVPLSKQAMEILVEIRPLTGAGRYVFPSVRSEDRPMSENTVLAALRRMGYGTGEMTGHGFRSMASTLMNEGGWNRDAIERQLAHAERDDSRAAYNYAEFLPERRKMMQWWANYLDELRSGKNILPGDFKNAA